MRGLRELLGKLKRTGELGRAKECTTGTRTHSYNAAVMWLSKWFSAFAIGRVFRRRLDWTAYIFTRQVPVR